MFRTLIITRSILLAAMLWGVSLIPVNAAALDDIVRCKNDLLLSMAAYDTAMGECSMAWYDSTISRFSAFCETVKECDREYRFAFHIDYSRYQIAWSYFRKYELLGDTCYLDSSRLYFDSLHTSSDIDIKRFSMFMSGESRFRKAMIFRSLVMGETGATDESFRVGKLLFMQADSAFDEMATVGEDTDRDSLDIYSRLRKADINYELGSLYLSADSTASAKEYFKMADYAEISTANSTRDLSHLQDAIDYSRGLTEFNLALLDRDTSAVKGSMGLLREKSNLYPAVNLAIGIGEMLLEAKRSTGAKFTSADPLRLDKTVIAFGKALDTGLYPEAYYWLTRADFVQMKYQQACYTMEKFLDSNYSSVAQDTCRLNRLRTASRRLMTLLKYCLTQSVSIDSLKKAIDTLSTAELQILFSSVYQKQSGSGASLYDRQLLKAATRVDSVLDFSRGFIKDPNLDNFYRSILMIIMTRAESDSAKKAQYFSNGKTFADNIHGDLASEGKYTRCQVIYHESGFSGATPIQCFDTIVKEFGSIRALYYIADMKRKSADSACLFALAMKQVLDKSPGSYDMPFWQNLVDSLEKSCENVPNKTSIDTAAERLAKTLNFHDSLCVYKIGGEDQPVTYEMLKELRLVSRQLAEETIYQFLKYGPPKLTLYPSIRRPGPPPDSIRAMLDGQDSRPCYSILDYRSFGDAVIPIPDTLPVSETWDLILKPVDSAGRYISGCIMQLKHPPAGCSATATDSGFTVQNIPGDSSIMATIRNDACYPVQIAIDSQIIGNYYTEVLLAETVHYDTSTIVNLPDTSLNILVFGDGRRIPICQFHWIGGQNVSFPIAPGCSAPNPPGLPGRLPQAGVICDVCYDPFDSKFYALGLDSAATVIRYDGDDKTWNPLRISSDAAHELNGPGSFAFDEFGDMYVADWGNSRVVKFDTAFTYDFAFGGFGVNDSMSAGQPVRFVLPTAVAIESDTVKYRCQACEGQPTFSRPRHLLVADYFGIHKTDSAGNYLSTVARFPAPASVRNVQYHLAVAGYGGEAVILLYDPGDKCVRVYEANTTNAAGQFSEVKSISSDAERP